MPVTKVPVSIQPAVKAELDARNEGNFSGALHKSLDRYFALLARARAEWRAQLSAAECALILDATNGSMFSDSVSLGMLWAEVEDACDLDALDAKWEVDGEALVAKIKASGILGQTALIDGAERWWNRVAAGEQPPYAELVEEAPGSRPALPYPQNVEE